MTDAMKYSFRSFHLFRTNLEPSISIAMDVGELDMKVPISQETRDKILRLLEPHIDAKLGISNPHMEGKGQVVKIHEIK